MADRAWRKDARRLFGAAGLRLDAWRNLIAVAEAIAASVDYRTMRARPTLARLCGVTGLSLRTVQRWTRWLERAGLLAVLEPGTTPQYRPGVLQDGGPNLAREWLLMPMHGPAGPGAAQRDITSGTPLHAYGITPYAGAREPGTERQHDGQDEARRSAPDSIPLGPPQWRARSPAWPLGQRPQRRAERLAACETLRAGHMVLRRLSARHLRSILREWFAAGWTPADVLYALDRAADDGEHAHADRVRHPAAWLAARLDHWRSVSGDPMPPRSARLAEAAAAHRAGQERRQAEAATLARHASTDVAGHAARARAMINAARWHR